MSVSRLVGRVLAYLLVLLFASFVTWMVVLLWRGIRWAVGMV